MDCLLRQVPGYNQLSEAEVMERYVAIEARKKRILEKRLRAQQREERRRQTEELSLKMAEARLQKKFEQQGINIYLCLLMLDCAAPCSVQ